MARALQHTHRGNDGEFYLGDSEPGPSGGPTGAPPEKANLEEVLEWSIEAQRFSTQSFDGDISPVLQVALERLKSGRPTPTGIEKWDQMTMTIIAACGKMAAMSVITNKIEDLGDYPNMHTGSLSKTYAPPGAAWREVMSWRGWTR